MLQSSSNNRKMDSRCPQENKPIKKEEKDSGKNKYTNSALLTHLVENSHLLLSKLPLPTQRKIKTNNEIPGVVENRDKVATPILQVSILFLRGKKRILPKSNAIPAIRKGIMPTYIFKIRKRSQKTSVSLGNLHADYWD